MKFGSRLFLFICSFVLGTAAIFGFSSYMLGRKDFGGASEKLLSQVRVNKHHEVRSEFTKLGDSLILFAQLVASKNLIPLLSTEFRRIKSNFDQSTLYGMEYSDISRYYTDRFPTEVLRQISKMPAHAVYLQHLFLQEAKKRGLEPRDIIELAKAPGYSRALAQTQPTVADFVERNRLRNLILVNREGDIVYGLEKSLVLGLNLRSSMLEGTNVAEAFRWAQTASPYSYRIFDMRPKTHGSLLENAIWVAVPIYNQSQTMGAILARVSSENLDNIMTDLGQWRSLGLKKSGEVLLVGADGMLRSNSRFQFDGTPEIKDILRKKMSTEGPPTGDTAMRLGYPKQTVLEWNHTEEGTRLNFDYLGFRSLQSFIKVPLPGVSWFVVAQMNKSEAYPSLIRSRWMGISAVLLFVLIALAYFLSRILARPYMDWIERVTSAAQANTRTLNPYNETSHFYPLLEAVSKMRTSYLEAIQEREQMSDVVNSLHEIVLVADSQTMLIEYANTATGRMIGIRAESLIGSRLDMWIGLDPAKLSKSTIRQEVQLRTVSGELIPIETSWALQKKNNHPGRLIVSAVDIRKRLDNSKLSEKRDKLFRVCQEVAKIGTFHWDLKADEMYWSDEAYSNVGLIRTAEKPTYTLFKSLVLPEDQDILEEGLRNARNSSTPVGVDVRIRRADNHEVVWIRCVARAEFDEYGMAAHLYGTSQDITATKKVEQALLAARNEALKSSRAKSEFLARMSHEIRTPMNAIMGMADLLKETPLNNDQKYYISIFVKAGEVLMALINDILDLSKIEAGEVSIENIPFNLRDLLEDLEKMMKPRILEKGLECSFDIKPFVAEHMMGDPNKLRQVLINLIGNAVKFTASGSIRVSVGRNPSKKDFLLISVTDTGLGIPAPKQHLIFQKFSQADSSITRRYGGTGLGLAISKSLIELMGGHIWFKSREGHGTSFFITIPYHEQVKSPTTERPIAMRAGTMDFVALKDRDPNKKIRILLADDTEDNRILFSRFLKDGPFEIVEAENGLEALDKIKSQEFDIVFMDVQMPKLDGYAATQQVREWEESEHKTHLPIIALTAHALSEDKERSLKAGCDEHITKPFKKQTILSVIESFT